MTDTHSPPPRKRHNDQDRRQPSRKRQRRPGPPPPPPKPVCSICSDAKKSPSYKCPNCLALYCSVPCCKQHKEVCPGKPPEAAQIKNKNPYALPPELLRAPPRVYGDDDDDDDSVDEGWKITDDMKSALQHSDWLRKQLQDGGLKQLIQQIVASKNTQALQEVPARYPHFGVFLDKLSVVAGVLERNNGDDHDEAPLDEWLQRDWSQEDAAPQLTLKPIFRRTMPVFEPVDASSSDEEKNQDSSEEETSSGDSSSEDEESSKASGSDKG
jgi:hypothetical protein